MLRLTIGNVEANQFHFFSQCSLIPKVTICYMLYASELNDSVCQ